LAYWFTVQLHVYCNWVTRTKCAVMFIPIQPRVPPGIVEHSYIPWQHPWDGINSVLLGLGEELGLVLVVY